MTPINRCPICRSEWYAGSPPPCDHSREEWEAHRKREAEQEEPVRRRVGDSLLPAKERFSRSLMRRVPSMSPMPDREPRDVLGEALRRDRFGLVRPLWADLQEAGIKEDWRHRADLIIARLAEAGYRIVKEGEG